MAPSLNSPTQNTTPHQEWRFTSPSSSSVKGNQLLINPFCLTPLKLFIIIKLIQQSRSCQLNSFPHPSSISSLNPTP